MSKKNKHRNDRNSPQDRSIPVGSQEYDLTQSFNKIRPYSRHTKRNNANQGTFSDEEHRFRGKKGVVSSESARYAENTLGVPDWNSYNRLEDRFMSFSDKNEEDHRNLRLELEGKIDKSSECIKNDLKELSQKIDKKLPKQWYIWTVIGIATMAGLIWTLSYQDVAKTPTELIELENRVEKVESKLTNYTQPIDSTITTNIESTKKKNK